MIGGVGELRQVGRHHWRWIGVVPGSTDAVRSSVIDALRLLRAISIEPLGEAIIAGIPGLAGPRWGATEEVTVRVGDADRDGSSLQVDSRSKHWALTDQGRNRSNVLRLIGALGIDER